VTHTPGSCQKPFSAPQKQPSANPAISVPAGFSPVGLPVGLQIVGRYRDDFGVLQLAHAFEQATEVWKRRPPLAA